jgi:probable HAF family extracellular repeat protein
MLDIALGVWYSGKGYWIPFIAFALFHLQLVTSVWEVPVLWYYRLPVHFALFRTLEQVTKTLKSRACRALIALQECNIMLKRSIFLITLLCVCLAVLCSVSAYAVSYSVTDIGTGLRPVDVNDCGVVVGFSVGNLQHGFVWQNGNLTRLQELGGIASAARGINNNNQVIGYVEMADSTNHGVLWQQGAARDLGFIGVPLVINDKGQMAGWSATSQGTGSGVITNIGSLGGATVTVTCINNSGVLAGYGDTANGYTDKLGVWRAYRHAFVGKKGKITDLGTLGGDESFGLAMNDLNQVVGYAERADETRHAFIWQNGSMTDLGIQDIGTSSATAINDYGQIVGSMIGSGVSKAVVWQNGVPVDLNTLIPANSAWNLTQATSVNDWGWIVGSGLYKGKLHGFLLTPAWAQAAGGVTASSVKE